MQHGTLALSSPNSQNIEQYLGKNEALDFGYPLGACHAVRRACVPRISALAPSHGKPTVKSTTPTEAPRVPPKQNARTRRLSGSEMSCSSLPSVVTPARYRWESIPANIRQRLLANAWCGQCRNEVTITNFTGTLKGGNLLLVGRCAECHGDVARVI